MSDKDELREHSFDGIQEYDNDLPRWWLWLFAITIIGSMVYPFIYDFGPADFDSETIDAEMIASHVAVAAVPAKTAASSESDLLKFVKDSAVVAEGQQLFATRCLACHGDKGQGLIGPNLTDEYSIHGGKITDLHKVIVNGVPEKGMLAWKDQLSPQQINAVVAYVWTLRGSNPPNPKAPQGDKVEG